LGERLLCKQEVIGSIPFTSTTGVVGRWRCDVWRRTKRDTVPGRAGAGCCLKGKERVCHVTEADMSRARRARAYPEKCLHARPSCVSGFCPIGVLPLCAAVFVRHSAAARKFRGKLECR
jgi:hypothetical protein